MQAIRVHGVTFVIWSDGGYILLERCPRKAEGLGVGEWFVPGGKIEQRENNLSALFREMQEELGIVPTSFEELPLIEGSPIPPTDRGVFLMRPFLVTAWSGKLPLTFVNREGVPLTWMHVDMVLRSPVAQVRAMAAMAQLVMENRSRAKNSGV